MLTKTKVLLLNSYRPIVGVVGLLAVMLIVGCAKPPTKEMADAEAALAAAKLAEADIYVPNEYRSAEDELAKARAEVEKKEYDEARTAAVESKKLSESAILHAGEAKARAKAEAEEIISQLKTVLNDAKRAEAETYYADDYKRISRTLDEMEADYSAEKYLDVISKGKEAVAQATSLAEKSRLAAAEAARRRAAEEARRRAAEEARRRAAEAEEARRRAAEAEEARRHPRTHNVVKGECLWRIAGSEKIYNDPFQWPLLYQANRSQINDPDLIYPKQELTVTRNASTLEIRQAITTAKTRGPWSLFDGK